MWETIDIGDRRGASKLYCTWLHLVNIFVILRSKVDQLKYSPIYRLCTECTLAYNLRAASQWDIWSWPYDMGVFHVNLNRGIILAKGSVLIIHFTLWESCYSQQLCNRPAEVHLILRPWILPRCDQWLETGKNWIVERKGKEIGI